MNKGSRKSVRRFLRPLVSALLLLHLAGAYAWAGDSGAADWRSIYDTVMLWVNFFILAFLIYYFGRRPFKNFLKGRQDEIADEIKKLEKQKEDYEEQIRQTRELIRESGERFEKIKSRITEEGRQKRQQIIDQANEQSKKMMEMEKKKAASRIRQARQRLLSELADSASSMAMSRLPAEMTEEDQEKMLSLYISQVSEYAQKTG